MNEIDLRREFNDFLKKSRALAKRDNCEICGILQSSFCNSHTIPKFILKEISCKGKVIYPSVISLDIIFDNEERLEIKPVDLESGINNAWTFHTICQDCDNKYFADYENSEILKEPFSNRIMAEIALKDVLLQIYKRYNELALFDLLQKRAHRIIGKELLDKEKTLDIRDFEFDKRRALKIINKGLKSGYKLLYWKKLPYTIPYSVQSGIALDRGISGNQINDLNNLSDNNRIESMHIGAFPLSGESVVYAFVHKDDRKYVKFEREFNRLKENEKLSYINYLSFKYTENICASPLLEDTINRYPRFVSLISENLGKPDFGLVRLFGFTTYTPVKMEEIPNLLSEEYSLEHIKVK